MKDRLLKFIKENPGCSLVDIYDKFKDNYSTHLILDVLTVITTGGQVVVNPTTGYHIKPEAHDGENN